MGTFEERVVQLEVKVDKLTSDVAELKAMIVALDEKVDRRFLWLAGVQVATLLALLAGMFGILTKLL